nr:glycosyltransferase [Lachnospiraceae bacterium]
MTDGRGKVKISLITVCLNSETTIGRTIDSVFAQNYDNIEYIIVDGCSTDSTLKIVKDKLKEAPFETVIVSEPDKGIYDAMNKGIKLATGDLICMLNSDDRLTDNALDAVAGHYDHTDLLVIYGMERRIKNGKEKECFLYGHEFIPERNLAHQACYISKKTYDTFGLYDTSYRSAADHDFILRLYMSGQVTFIPVYEVLIDFYEGGISSGCLGNIEGARVRKKYGTIGT